jgi:rare lipoprotein A
MKRSATIAAVLALLVPGALDARAEDTGGARPFSTAPGVSFAPGGLIGRTVQWAGELPGAESARIERLDAATGTWTQIATAPVTPDGTFEATWRADRRAGRYTVRAVPDAPAREASAADAPPSAQVTVFRGQRATWYGPGFFGRKTACGQRLRRTTVGVAHRKLKCGTKVEVFHDGRSLVVPVIDRGPYANRARWDLTAAAAEALGFTETGVVGVARVSKR